VQKHYHASLMMLLMLAISSFVINAYGHGLGQDETLPVTISGKQVAVEGRIEPSFLPIAESSTPTFVIRTHDESNNATLAGIDYRIAVELRNETLLDQRFRSTDGIVQANLVPDSDIEGWQINGQRMMPSEQIQVSQSNPVELRSKILSAGGLYHIVVTIEKSSTGISLQADQKFDLYISVGEVYTFDIETPQGQNQMLAKTYYDEITNFDYSNKTVSFEMPFTWDPAYIAQVPVLHMEVQFPKSIQELQTNSYRGMLNSRELEAQALVIDDYSSEQNRIVHFIVSNAMLTRFAETINGNNNTAVFALLPSEKPKFPLDIMSLPSERFLLQLSWGPDIIETGIPTTFVMNIQDPATGDLVRGSSFDLAFIQDGTQIQSEHLTSDFGTYSYEYTFTKPGTVSLAANNINGQGESARIDLTVLQGSGNTSAQTSPQSQQQQQQQPAQSQCLIATAAFGSELSPHVKYLRHFRDQYILSTASGSAFMSTFNSIYYSFSPQVAQYEREQPWFQGMIKVVLYPLFGILMTAERGYSMMGGGEAGSILSGAIASSLIGVLYLWPIGFAASKRVNNRLLVIIVGVATSILTVSIVALPAMLSFGTAIFVMALAATSAIAIAKPMRYYFSRHARA
jgi:type IV secretory pathway TrbD component